jgi:predicted Mrr-cat superfamily restriction endonuclease
MNYSTDYLQFHLIKILQEPPQEKKANTYTHLYNSIAQKLGLNQNTLIAVLDEMNGPPHRYWRIGTTAGYKGKGENVWGFMREGNYAAIGWTELDDLSDITPDKAGKEEIRKRLDDAGYDSTNPNVYPPFKFATEIMEGDLILASRSLNVLGLGRVDGCYYYENNDDDSWPHRIPVEWISLEEWTLPRGNVLQPTLYEIKNVTNLIAIERHLLNVSAPDTPKVKRKRQTKKVPKTQKNLENNKLAKKREIKSQKQILAHMMKCSPTFFETIVMHLLESIYDYGDSRKVSSTVTARTGDEGIDGILKIEHPLGSPEIICMQAKRWKEGNNVSRPEIQKFAGSLLDANRGVFVTTSDFTKSAEEFVGLLMPKTEIILINGKKLAELVAKHSMDLSDIEY